MDPEPHNLAISVTKPDGRVYRWGPDEADTERVPQDLTFSTTIPGGYKSMECSLSRDVTLDYPDLGLYDDIRVYGPGGVSAWEGRVAQLPRQLDNQQTIQVGGVGWVAHLDDDETWSELYVDREMGGWRSASVQRRLNLVATNLGYVEHSIVPDQTTGIPSIELTATGTWGSTGEPSCETWYDAGPNNRIGSIYYEWRRNANINVGDTNWFWLARLATNDDLSGGFDTTINLRAVGPGSGTLTTTAARRYAQLLMYYPAAGPAGAAGTKYSLYWGPVAVYGDHGLTKRGANPQGLYVSDIVSHIVASGAPLLNTKIGGESSIELADFIVPQLAFTTPTKPSEALAAANAYELNEWGVYDNKTFFYRRPDPANRTWTCRLSDGAQLSVDGVQADDVYNGVYVYYRDPVGETKTVGPPGSNADVTSTSLIITDPENVVNKHGIARRWAVLDISQTTTAAGATQMGAVWLAERALPQYRGQLTITGEATHPTNGTRPVYEMKAGDYVRIADYPNTQPRRIIETSYKHASKQQTLSLDNTVFKLEAIMERIGISLAGVI